MAAKRKEIYVRKLQAEVQRLSGDLKVLERCVSMPEGCTSIVNFIEYQMQNDPLASSDDVGEDNPYTAQPPRQGPCVCILS